MKQGKSIKANDNDIVLISTNQDATLLNSGNEQSVNMTDDNKIDIVAENILKKYKAAFNELAK